MKDSGSYFAPFRGTMKKVLLHGVLHRQYTSASGGPYCNYFITGDKEDIHGTGT